jgi:hypothetical protein
MLIVKENVWNKQVIKFNYRKIEE